MMTERELSEMIDLEKTIKKCPFCGHQAHMRKGFGFLGSIAYRIECDNCKASIPPLSAGHGYMEFIDGKCTGKLLTRDDNNIADSLINKWNRRIG